MSFRDELFVLLYG